jgi:hypothetical protein
LESEPAEARSSYDDLWAAATAPGGTVTPPRPGPSAPQPGAAPEEGQETGADDEFEGVEDAARARARALREKIQREAPPTVEVTPLGEQILARVRPLIRPAIYLVIAAVVCIVGYVAWYQALGPGKVARETLASADKSIREGYQAIQKGLETPDAALLAQYAPKRMDRASTQAEINDKNAQLRGLQIRCTIQVLRVELEDLGEGALAVPRARATIALQVKGARISVMSQGEQVWQRVQDRWLPDQDPKNWHVFGNAPVTM